MNLSRYTILPALALAGAFVLGCASDDKPGIAPVPEGLDPRPELSSIPDESVRVVVSQGGAKVGYDLVEGQRYFLVDESTDTLLTSGVADRDGELTIGEGGAEFRGDNVWNGTVSPNSQIGLYVNSRLETP